jgi:hypothetical protein
MNANRMIAQQTIIPAVRIQHQYQHHQKIVQQAIITAIIRTLQHHH